MLGQSNIEKNKTNNGIIFHSGSGKKAVSRNSSNYLLSKLSGMNPRGELVMTVRRLVFKRYVLASDVQHYLS